MSDFIPIEWSNVPPGLAQIFPPRVIAARQHRDSGTWIGIRAIANAAMASWYHKANYAAAPFVIYEYGEFPALSDNLSVVFAAANEALEKGPPKCVLDEIAARLLQLPRGKAPKGKTTEAKEPKRTTVNVEDLKREAVAKKWPESGSIRGTVGNNMKISYDGARAVRIRKCDESTIVTWSRVGEDFYSLGFHLVGSFTEYKDAEAAAWREIVHPSVDVVALCPDPPSSSEGST